MLNHLFNPVSLFLTLTSLSGMSSSLGPPISSSSSSFFFFWFLSCFSFSAFFFSSSSWAFFWALRCLFLSFFSSLSERLAVAGTQWFGRLWTAPMTTVSVGFFYSQNRSCLQKPLHAIMPHRCQPAAPCCRQSEDCRGGPGKSEWP